MHIAHARVCVCLTNKCLLISNLLKHSFIIVTSRHIVYVLYLSLGHFTVDQTYSLCYKLQIYIFINSLGAPEITSSIDKYSYMLIEGHPLTLLCPVLSNPSPTTQWTHLLNNDNSLIIIDSTSGRFSFGDNNSLIITSLNITDNGLFVCNVSNEYGFVTIQHSLTIYGNLLIIHKVYLLVILLGIPSPPKNLASVNIDAESYTLSWQHTSVPFASADYYTLDISKDNGLTFYQVIYYTLISSYNN